MRNLIIPILFVFSISLSFAQNTQTIKRFGFTVDIPATWETSKDKAETVINDPNWEAFVTIKRFDIKDGNDDAMLLEITDYIYEELKNYIPKEMIDKKLKVSTQTDKKNKDLEYIALAVEGEPDEDNQVAIFHMRIYKRNNKAVAFSAIDFGEAVDPDNEYDVLLGKYWTEILEIMSSIRLN